MLNAHGSAMVRWGIEGRAHRGVRATCRANRLDVTGGRAVDASDAYAATNARAHAGTPAGAAAAAQDRGGGDHVSESARTGRADPAHLLRRADRSRSRSRHSR